MRTFFANSLVGFALLAGLPSATQAQCLLCGIVGYLEKDKVVPLDKLQPSAQK